MEIIGWFMVLSMALSSSIGWAILAWMNFPTYNIGGAYNSTRLKIMTVVGIIIPISLWYIVCTNLPL